MTRTIDIIAGLILTVGLILLPATAPAADEQVATYALGEGLTATVDQDGTIVVHVSDGSFTAPALTCRWPHATDPRRKDEPLVFMVHAREGDVCGRRGFTRDADDDGDGRIDEDILDGTDNDGDGRVDEDFAAVSHAMTVWDWSHGPRRRHLETYQWSYPHLTGLLAAVYTTDAGSSADPLQLSVPDATWVQTDEFCFREDVGQAGPTFVTRILDPRHPGRTIWLGVAMLDAEPRRAATERVHASGSDLTVPLLGSTQAVALAAGPTRLRVAQDLASSAIIRAGVKDPVSGQRVTWLPAAVPQAVTEESLPEAALRPNPSGGFDLLLTYVNIPRLAFDPDLFAVDGELLAGPVALVWSPADERAEVTLDWPLEGGMVDACHPYDHFGADGPGVFTLRYRGGMPTTGLMLDGVLADGRRAAMPVTVLTLERDESTTEPVLAQGDQRLQLSPLLLSNYPNPFRNTTQVSYQIPATAGEAFLWEGDGEPPFDARQRLPFAGGGATVSVVVYDLEGREIATLFTGILGVGRYQARWDGMDQAGRIMASGAYFCKFQIENWSVTKRLIFIR